MADPAGTIYILQKKGLENGTDIILRHHQEQRDQRIYQEGRCEFSHAWLYGAFEDTLHAGGRTGGISAGEVRTCRRGDRTCEDRRIYA